MISQALSSHFRTHTPTLATLYLLQLNITFGEQLKNCMEACLLSRASNANQRDQRSEWLSSIFLQPWVLNDLQTPQQHRRSLVEPSSSREDDVILEGAVYS